jgi:hypothetical protein
VAEDISKLISYLQSNPVKVTPATPQARPANRLGITYNTAAPSEPSDMFQDAVQGSLNIFGGFMRGLTSIGRGVTNLAAGTLPYANAIYDMSEDGISADEIPKIGGALANATWGGLTGLAKGVAYSFMDPTAKSRRDLNKLFGGPTPVEGAYELFQSENFANAAKNIPALGELSSQEELFTLPAPAFSVPWLGIEKGVGMPVTKTGLYSFGWDVLTDPASYVTLGFGGAAKGAISGIQKATKGAVQRATPEAMRDAAEIAATQAKSFYPRTVSNPAGDAAYNGYDTNPFVFIAKETGRGFVEAHKNARRLRVQKKSGENLLTDAVARTVAKGEDPGDADALYRSIDEIGEQVRRNNQEKTAALKAEKDVTPEDSTNAIGDAIARSVTFAKEIVEKNPDRIARLAEIAKRVDPNKVQVVLRAEAARAVARSIKETQPFVKQFEDAKYNAPAMQQLGDSMLGASDVGGDIASTWDEFVANSDPETVLETVRSIFSPVGWRESRRGAKTVDDAGEQRKLKAQDPSTSKEMRQLLSLVKGDLTRVSPKTTKGRSVQGAEQATVNEINDAVLAARKKLAPLEEWNEAKFKEIADNISGADLAKALDGKYRLFGERLRYAALRAETKQTPEAALLENLSRNEYNPFTVEAEPRTLATFRTTATGKGPTRSEVIKLAAQAGGDTYDSAIAELFKRAGVRRFATSSNIESMAVDLAHIILLQAERKRFDGMNLKVENARLGLLDLQRQVAPRELSLTEKEFEALAKKADRFAPNAKNLSEQDALDLLDMAAELRQKRMNASELLASPRFSIATQGPSSILRRIGTTDFRVAEEVTKKGLSRFAATPAADEIGKMRGAFQRENIALDEAGNLDLEAAYRAIDGIVNTSEGSRALAEVKKLIVKNGRFLKIPADKDRLIMELLRDVQTQIAIVRDSLENQGFPGFSEVFKTRGVGSVTDFMSIAYATSRRKNSPDGGRFADYIDETFLGARNLPPRWKDRLSVAERSKVFKSYSGKWGGQGLTPALLEAVIATKNTGTSKAPSAKEYAAFKKAVGEILIKAKESAAVNLAETAEFPVDSRTGWLQTKINDAKTGEKKLSDPELDGARKAFFGQSAGPVIPKEQLDALFTEISNRALASSDKAMKDAAAALKFLDELDSKPNGYTDLGKKYGAKAAEAMIEKANKALDIFYERLPARPRDGKMTGALAWHIERYGIPVGGKIKAGVDAVLPLAQKAAIAKVRELRAEKLLDEVWPESASAETLLDLFEKVGDVKGYAIAQAELLLAKQTSIYDVLTKRADAALKRKTRKGDVEGLRRERTQLDKILAKVQAKLVKDGYRRPATINLDIDLSDLKTVRENPHSVIELIRTMSIETDADARRWKQVIDVFNKLGSESSKSLFRTGPELIDAWKARSPEVSDELVANVLASYGVEGVERAINAGRIPKRRTLMAYVERSGDIIEQAELERIRMQNAYIEAGLSKETADELQAAFDSIPETERANIVESLQAQMMDLVSVMEADTPWLVDATFRSLGESVNLFFRLTQDPIRKVPNKLLGTTTDIVPFKATKRGEIGIKRSREILTQYTEFAAIVSEARQHARNKYPDDVAKQDLVTMQWTTRALRLRDMYYMLRGVVPASTPMISRAAKEIGIFSSPQFNGIEKVTFKPVFLSDADVLEAMPTEMARDILFLERVDSMPYTSMMEGARVLVAHMDNLKPGEFFNEEQYQAVYLHMYNNMVSEALRSSTAKYGKGDSWFTLNPEENSLRIRQYIEYWLSEASDGSLEAPAFRLLEKHRQNAIYATVVASNRATGEVVGAIRDGWIRAVNSDIASAGDKIAATLDAMKLLNDEMKLENFGQDFGEFMARRDAMVLIASSMDREAAAKAAEQAAIKEVIDTPEMQGIKAAIASSQKKKELEQLQKELLMKEANARVDIQLDTLAQKEMAIRESGINPEHGDMVDLVNDVITDSTKINWLLRTADRILTKFSYNYGMERLRDIYGGVSRNTIELESMFMRSNVGLSRYWAKVTNDTGVDYPKLAVESLVDIPDDMLEQFLESLDIVRKGFHSSRKGSLDIGTAATVAEHLEHIRYLGTFFMGKKSPFDNLDELGLQALADVAAQLFTLFGKNGALNFQRAPVELYNGFLAKIGARGEVGFNPSLDPNGLADAWKEMDFSKPFEAMNHLHFAYAEAERLRVLGTEVTRMSGARKLSDFETLEAAKAQGFVKINGPKEIKIDSGNEVMYFMDTDNFLYPIDMVSEIKTFSNFVSQAYKGLGAGFAKFMQRFTRVQDFAKQNMTTLRPGNHVMNAMGMFFINDIAGMRNPLNYVDSAEMLFSLAVKEADLGVDKKSMFYWQERYIAEQKAAGFVIRPESDPTKAAGTAPIVVNGKTVSIQKSDLAKLYKDIGGMVGFQQSMMLDLLTEFSDANNLRKMINSRGIKEGYQALTDFAGKLASTRDNWGRMALWLDVLKKGKWTSLEDGAREALKIVDRYHPQPQDVSKFNRIVSRQAILFFTWRAKTLGALTMDLLERPGRLLTYEKAYYNLQAGMGSEPEYFGSHDPEDKPVRSFQQNTLGLLTADSQYSFSVANPMWDLFGTDSWLAAIEWDKNQSPAANAMNVTLGTAGQVFYSATPLLGNFLLNWFQGRTSNGVDLMRGGITNEDMPKFIEDVAGSFGLNAQYALAAYYFPGIVEKGKWTTMTSDERSQELLRTWFNWATGARASKYLTPDNRKAARSELKSSLKVLQRREAEANQPVNSPGESLGELIQYLQGINP